MKPKKQKPKDFASRLLAWRASKGLIRDDAAVELKVSARSLQEWEQRRRAPRLASVEHVLARLIQDGF